MERRRLPIEPVAHLPRPWKSAACRLAAGLGSVAALHLAAGWLPVTLPREAVHYTLVGLCVTLLAPLLFRAMPGADRSPAGPG